MYFPFFALYILIGLAISLTVFFWALHNGQFQDQQRARFLPLQGDADAEPVAVTRWGRLETIGLFILAVAGLGATGAVLVVALIAKH